MNGVPGIGGVVQLAEVVRGGFVESRHVGLAVALDRDGRIVHEAGDDQVQQRIAQECARLAGTKIDVTTVDGCGAPLLGFSLTGLARAFARLATAPPGTPEAAVADAMRTHPELVGGRGHVNTEVMRLLPGVLAKGGAEGVLAMAAPDRSAVAVKAIDGSPRATTAIALALLERCGTDTSAAEHLRTVSVLGGGQVVGEIRPSV